MSGALKLSRREIEEIELRAWVAERFESGTYLGDLAREELYTEAEILELECAREGWMTCLQRESN